jgi:hypothetical protein
MHAFSIPRFTWPGGRGYGLPGCILLYWAQLVLSTCSPGRHPGRLISCPYWSLQPVTLSIFFLCDITIRKEEFKVSLDISMKIFSYGLSSVFQIFIPLVIAVVTRQLDEKKWQAQNQKVLEQRTFQLEKEKMQADYLFLKAQINPHFLHNTLNFLYSRRSPIPQICRKVSSPLRDHAVFPRQDRGCRRESHCCPRRSSTCPSCVEDPAAPF